MDIIYVARIETLLRWFNLGSLAHSKTDELTANSSSSFGLIPSLADRCGIKILSPLTLSVAFSIFSFNLESCCRDINVVSKEMPRLRITDASTQSADSVVMMLHSNNQNLDVGELGQTTIIARRL